MEKDEHGAGPEDRRIRSSHPEDEQTQRQPHQPQERKRRLQGAGAAAGQQVRSGGQLKPAEGRVHREVPDGTHLGKPRKRANVVGGEHPGGLHAEL